MATPETFLNLPTELLGLVQEKMLLREFQQALRAKRAYRLDAEMMELKQGQGETITKTRMARKAVDIRPMDPNLANTQSNNGVTPSTPGMEQYKLTLHDWGGSIPLNLRQNMVEIKRRFTQNAFTNGDHGSQTLEWLCRNEWFNRYMGGDTRCVVAYGASSATTCYVDDIRGFQTVMGTDGNEHDVGSSFPLQVKVSGSQSLTLNVTGAVADGTNHSTAAQAVTVGGGAISGTLTFDTIGGSRVADGDRLLAKNASKILRAGGRSTTAQITGSDTNKFGLVMDAKTYLENQNAPKYSDGTYHWTGTADSMRQFFDDPKFLNAFQAQYKSREFQEGEIYRVLGVSFYTTTEALLNDPVTGLSGAANCPQKIQRSILTADGGMIQGYFEGNGKWLEDIGGALNGQVEQVDDLTMILRAPQDNFLQNIVQSWQYGGDFCCPSDYVTAPETTPTASRARYKRAVIMEHAGGVDS